MTAAKLQLATAAAKAAKDLENEVAFLKNEMHERGMKYVKMITQLQVSVTVTVRVSM